MITAFEVSSINRLIESTWKLSGLPRGNTISDYNMLAWHISDHVDCDIIGKSIKELSELNESHPRTGFLKNRTKEVLSLYYLVKSGKLSDGNVEYIEGNKTRKPRPLYWREFLSSEHIPVPESSEQSSDGLKFIPSQFINTRWWCYSAGPKGILVGLLEIFQDKHNSGYNRIEVRTGTETNDDFVGYIATDPGNCYLIINALTRISRQKHVHVKLRLGGGVLLPRISIGQMNYISGYESKILTRTIVLVRQTNGQDENSTLYPGYYPQGSREFNTIDPVIREYLYPKEKNRLASPVRDISTLSDLEDWLSDQRKNSRVDEILQSYSGKYFLYKEILQNGGSRELEQSSFELHFCPAAMQMHATLVQANGQVFTTSQVQRYGQFIGIFWEHKLGGEVRTLYLNFRIGHMNYSRYERFCGIMTGVSLKLDAIASLSVLIIKAEMQTQGVQDKRILQFFSNANGPVVCGRGGHFRLD